MYPHPLVLALLAFLAGLLPALRFSPSPLIFVVAALAASVVALHAARAAPVRAHAALLLAFACAGAGLGAKAACAAAADCRLRLRDGVEVTVRGALAAGSRPGSRSALPLAGAEVELGGAGCRGALRVRLPDGVAPAPAGTELRVRGRWVVLDPPVVASAWPRDPVFHAVVRVDSVLEVRPASGVSTPLLYLRGRAEGVLRGLFPRHGPLAEALLLGRREGVDREVRERFARSGLVHLLAISGAHVGMIAAMLLLLGGVARLSRRRCMLATLGAVAVYLAVIGAPASAVRAGLMLGLALGARLLQRPAATLPMMAAAALILVAVDPLSVLDPGLQLSFAGVAGVLLAHRVALAALPTGWRRRRLAWWALETLAVGLGAFLATAPIVAHHFGRVAPVSVLAGLPATPLVALALAGVAASAALYPLAPPVARLVADGTSVALDALVRVAELASEAPLADLPVPRPHWTSWIAAALVATLALRLGSRLRPRARVPAAAGLAAALLLAAPAVARRDVLEIHFLDVGQGDATAVRTPRGRWLLVDAGPRSRDYDAGARRVLPFLRAHGARRLEALILTHPDLDHIGGAVAVLRAIPVALVVEPGLPVGKESYLELLREVEARGVAWRAARSGRVLTLDGVRLEFLWPDSASLDPGVEANQISAVIRLEFQGFALLLPGDAPAEVERLLVRRHGAALRAAVLKAGHHGSATSSSDSLLATVRPRLVVVSAGRRNRYGHPAPEVLQRLARGGIDLARTDREGTVSLRVAPGGRWTRVEP